jgi:hypothetical protein
MFIAPVVVSAIVGFASCVVTPKTYAGEIESGIGSCDVDSPFMGCTWKAKGCDKPVAPVAFASDVESYNRAVTEFNEYLTEVRSYEDCIIAEGKRDIGDKLPDIVTQGAKKQIDEADTELNEARTNLQMMRPQ